MQKSSEIKALTGLRGAAAGFVVLYHFLSLRSGLPAHILKHGYLAVDLFFVLSGFVMAMTYGAEFIGGYSALDHARFLLKRLGRVYPLYLVVTLACALLAGLGVLSDVTVDARTFICNVMLVQAWGLSNSLDAPGWSISAEAAAYLLFPVFAHLVLARSWNIAWATAVSSAGLLVLVSTRSDLVINQVIAGVAARNGPLDVHDCHTLFPMIRCFAEFLLGLFAWRCIGLAAVRRVVAQPALQWLVLAGVAALLAVPRADVAAVLLFVPLIMSLSAAPTGTATLFSLRPIHWLGLISYSLYLVHYPLHQLSEPVFSTLNDRFTHAYLVLGLALLLPALGLSALGFYGIEKPGRTWSRRWLDHHRLAPRARPGQGHPTYGRWAQRRAQPAIQPGSSPQASGGDTQ